MASLPPESRQHTLHSFVGLAKDECVAMVGVSNDIGERQCRKCTRLLPLRDFPINNTLKSHVLYKHTCNSCRAIQSKDRARLHRAHTRPGPGTCPICHRHTVDWVLDHDHETGAFRGWLCNCCNNALGKFGDCPRTLRRALAYLEHGVGGEGLSDITSHFLSSTDSFISRRCDGVVQNALLK